MGWGRGLCDLRRPGDEVGGLVVHNVSVVEDEDPVGVGGVVEFCAGEQDGSAVGAAQERVIVRAVGFACEAACRVVQGQEGGGPGGG